MPGANFWDLTLNLLAEPFNIMSEGPLGRGLKQVWQLVLGLTFLLAGGLLLITFGHILGISRLSHAIVFAGFLVLLFTASFVAGGGLGVLFGIPKIRGDASKDRERELDSNSNLERISDWLTNGIVALALVKLGVIGRAVYQFGELIGRQFPTPESAPLIAQTVLISGAVIGFVFGFIQTRTVLTLTLNATEEALYKVKTALSAIDVHGLEDAKVAVAIATAQAAAGQTQEASQTAKRARELLAPEVAVPNEAAPKSAPSSFFSDV